ncbi:MAG: sigma-70 family RNA polymerase sigma factor [Planctomycetes bacterium]|nr:sigma-70 family RNA polymerase sigma factor [Planctomycetota bacterium]
MIDEIDRALGERLLASYEAGDSDALDKLFAKQRGRLVKFAAGRMTQQVRRRADASDLVQEAMHDATRRIRDYLRRRPMPFDVWLRKLVYERVIMSHRRHCLATSRSTEREAMLSEESSLLLAERLLADDSTPSARLKRGEKVAAVREALSRLNERDREILICRGLEEMPYDEIAALLDCELATARQWYGRALRKLYEQLSDLGWSRDD